ncbi:HlyD family secretion protein [Granulibacter bethesdensis]|uniref:HlyD family secretion protein n=1 Tax=Granulibacter bethesdensis TaxID=364410 RepID=UPI00090B7D07|nr:HlyD family secretion protein [Granulibacter bethesdensis]APH60080.1 Multidrug resistance protein A [Granulibacter bethesdensis]
MPDDVNTASDSPARQGGSNAQPQGSQPQGSQPQGRAMKKRSPLVRVILILTLLGIVAGGVYYWYTHRDLETTDDAYTSGRAVMISPQVAGYVVDLNVRDNQFVHKGEVLVRLDPRPYQAAVEVAEGQLAMVRAQHAATHYQLEIAKKNFPAQLDAAKAQKQQAEAQLFRAQTDYRRQHSVARAATTQEAIDASTASLRSAQAQLASAQAAIEQAMPVEANINETGQRVDQLAGQIRQAEGQLEQAKLNLEYATIVAPQDGWVTKRNVEKGNFLQTGTQIMSLVSPEIWVVANFKETQLTRMRPGQKVHISIDAYPWLNLKGHVDSIQQGSGSRFTAFPAENATGNFVKIVQRVPVKIHIDRGIDPSLPIPLGLSVEPVVDLSSTPENSQPLPEKARPVGHIPPGNAAPVTAPVKVPEAP